MNKVRALVVALLVAGAWVFWPRVVLSHNPITTTVLFNREIAALLQSKCLQCHADGKMAMSLATYEAARPWAVAIKEEVLARHMPPWPAESGYGQFANDAGLTTREMDFLLSWVEGGAPEGDGAAPAFVDHSSHWMLGEPQVTATARQGVVVDANSAAHMARLVLDSGLAQDTWIRAIDFRPGDPRVARAAFFTVVETGEYLGGWTPWSPSTELPAGVAFRLPAHAHIAVDVLYRGISEQATDVPRLALYAAGETPMRRASTVTLRTSAAGPQLRGRLVMSAATTLFALRPEMQPGGASIEVTATRPDGSRDVLVLAKRFGADWQTPFVFRQPVSLPAGTAVDVVATPDGSPPGAAPRSLTVTMTRYDDMPARAVLVPAHEPEQEGTTAWFCPMHPDVTSAQEGRCRKCGMTLVAGHPFDTRDYALTMRATPGVRSGTPFQLRFDIRNPSSGAPVRDFAVVHDKRYHLFVVSHDMQVFQHVHPDQQPDGSWTIEATVPKPGAYRLVSDFLPAGGAPQLLARTLVTADFTGDLASQDAHLQPDTVLSRTVGPLTAAVKFEPPQLVAGEYGHLEFTLTDAKTKEPVTDLQPYLGAFGHAFVLSEDLRDSVHSHPPEWRDGKEISSGFGGPTVLFEGYMPRPGRYRIWTQFLRRGELTTIPFTFEVSTVDQVYGRR
ncbi:MAG: hypothetical protein HY824_08480 [Acidobacteria bacterium]|nr:hypothetical protein [Acidobacteriota bacterium]